MAGSRPFASRAALSLISSVERDRRAASGVGCWVRRIHEGSHPLTPTLSPWERGLDRAGCDVGDFRQASVVGRLALNSVSDKSPAQTPLPWGGGGADAPGVGCWVRRIHEGSHPLTPTLSPWERGLDRAGCDMGGLRRASVMGRQTLNSAFDISPAQAPLPGGEVGADAPGEGRWVRRIHDGSHPLTPTLSPWERGLDRGCRDIAGLRRASVMGRQALNSAFDTSPAQAPLPWGEVGADAPGEGYRVRCFHVSRKSYGRAVA